MGQSRDYTVTVKVTDSAGSTGTDFCTITVCNKCGTIDSQICPNGVSSNPVAGGYMGTGLCSTKCYQNAADCKTDSGTDCLQCTNPVDVCDPAQGAICVAPKPEGSQCTVDASCDTGLGCFQNTGNSGYPCICQSSSGGGTPCTTYNTDEYDAGSGLEFHVQGEEVPPTKPCPPESCPPLVKGGTGSGSLSLDALIPGNFTDFLGLLSCVFSYLVYFAIPIAVIIFALAGMMLLTSRGDPGKTETGKKILLWGLIGFIVVLLSKGILMAILSFFGSGSVTFTCSLFS
ncbi:MAG: pilin [bacterium]|nr:pilin [bacterium]